MKRNCDASSIIMYMYAKGDHTIHVHWRQNYPQTFIFHFFNMFSSPNRPVFFFLQQEGKKPIKQNMRGRKDSRIIGKRHKF